MEFQAFVLTSDYLSEKPRLGFESQKPQNRIGADPLRDVTTPRKNYDVKVGCTAGACYVSGDPVNFIDPDGLTPLVIPRVTPILPRYFNPRVGESALTQSYRINFMKKIERGPLTEHVGRPPNPIPKYEPSKTDLLADLFSNILKLPISSPPVVVSPSVPAQCGSNTTIDTYYPGTSYLLPGIY